MIGGLSQPAETNCDCPPKPANVPEGGQPGQNVWAWTSTAAASSKQTASKLVCQIIAKPLSGKKKSRPLLAAGSRGPQTSLLA